MLKLKSTTTTYRVSLDELKFMFKEQLGDPGMKAEISISPINRTEGYGPQERDVFDGLLVTISENK